VHSILLSYLFLFLSFFHSLSLSPSLSSLHSYIYWKCLWYNSVQRRSSRARRCVRDQHNEALSRCSLLICSRMWISDHIVKSTHQPKNQHRSILQRHPKLYY
jgi:hypothetical protein